MSKSLKPGQDIRNLPSARADWRRADWRPLKPYETHVEFDIGGDEEYLRRVANLIGDRADVAVECGDWYGRFGQRDLEFLRFFPKLRRFRVHEGSLTSLEGLRHLPDDLIELTIMASRPQVSLAPLRRFPNLQTLSLERQHRDVAVIGELVGLEDLTLRSMTLSDLSILLPLERLRSLDIKLGGTNDLGLLPRIGRLDYLELWLIRGLDDVDAIGEIVTLENLHLQALSRVTRLPSFRRLDRLRSVYLETMHGLSDLTGVAEAPALEILHLVDFRHASPEIVRPFIGHPTLRESGWGFGSTRKNFAAQDLVALDPELRDRDKYEAFMRAFRARG